MRRTKREPSQILPLADPIRCQNSRFIIIYDDVRRCNYKIVFPSQNIWPLCGSATLYRPVPFCAHMGLGLSRSYPGDHTKRNLKADFTLVIAIRFPRSHRLLHLRCKLDGSACLLFLVDYSRALVAVALGAARRSADRVLIRGVLRVLLHGFPDPAE